MWCEVNGLEGLSLAVEAERTGCVVLILMRGVVESCMDSALGPFFSSEEPFSGIARQKGNAEGVARDHA